MRKTTLRTLFVLFLFSTVTNALWAETEISDRAGLEAIQNDLGGDYKLVADIDLTGADWVPIGSDSDPFTGTLDGNGHVITGLRYDNTTNDGQAHPAGSRKVGLFSVINGGSVKKLGIDQSYVKGGKHVGAIAGTLKASAIVEECAVTNSYVETADHGGSIVGNMEGNSIVRNCYANARVYSRGSQASGLVGMYKDTGTTIQNSYFAGTVQSGNPSGLGAWNDGDSPTCEKSVNLAPYVLGSSNLRVCVGNNSTINNLYSLASTILDGNKENFSAIGTITNINDGNYGADKRHGAHIPDGDANSLSQSFYEETLGWDFDNIWKMPANGYPVLQWQTAATTNISVVAISTLPKNLNPVNSLNLTDFVFVSNTWKGASTDVIEFTTTSEYVDIVNGNIKLNATGLAETGTIDITINVVGKAGYNVVGDKSSFTVKLKPEYIDIADANDLLTKITDPEAAYRLTADIDMTGIDFAPLPEFKGVFDGNGHVIKGLTYTKPTDGTNDIGLFKVTTGGAIIKNLGIENANFNGWNDVGGIVGQAKGFTVIENCYVANSYLEGRDHVAAIAGALREGSIIRNCYSNAKVHSRDHQAGGLSGIMNWGAIYNSYFAGIVSNSNNRAVGIGGYQDNAGQAATNIVIENSVCLAPYLLSSNYTVDAMRVLHDARNDKEENKRPATLINNYGLSTTWTGKLDKSEGFYIEPSNVRYGLTNLHGANVTPTDATTQVFYETTLGWDFADVWVMTEIGYPVLQWQTTPVKAAVLDQEVSYDLEKENTNGLDLALLLPNTHGFTYTITPDDADKVTVEGSVIKVAATWDGTASEATFVTLTAPADYDFDPVVVNLDLIPGVSLADLSVTEGTLVPAFDPAVTSYTLSVDGSIANITLAATGKSGITVVEDGVGVKAVNYGHNTFTVTATNGVFDKDYTIKVDRGLFSVSKLDGTGKRSVNIYSHDSNNDKESAYRLLIGKDEVKSGDDKWCHSNGDNKTPQVTFSFAGVYEVGAVEWRDKGFREGTSGQIDNWKVEVSMDADDWTEIINATGEANLTIKYKTVEPVQARFMRFTPTKAEGQGAAWIYGFDIYGKFVSPLKGDVLSIGKTILSYEGGYYQGFGRETPANILDGYYNTAPWASYGHPLSVDIDLEDSYEIGAFKVVADQNEKDHITGFKVYTKANLEDAWVETCDVTDMPTDKGVQERLYRLQEPPVEARYVKLEIPAEYKFDKNDAWARIKEFEVLDETYIIPTSVEGLSGSEISFKAYQISSNSLMIKCNAEKASQIEVYDVLGNRVASQPVSGSSTVINHQFVSGVYIVSIQLDGKVSTSKIVIK